MAHTFFFNTNLKLGYKMKDYVGCLIPIAIILAIGTLMALHNKKEEQDNLEKQAEREKLAEEKNSEKVRITQGEYSRFIEDTWIYPCLDEFKEREYVTKGELVKLPIHIYDWPISDTIYVSSDCLLREAAIVFHSLTKSDTLDFEYDGWDYIVKCSQTSLAWDDINKVSFLFKFDGDYIRHELALNKQEFKQCFEDVIPYITLKKLRTTK